MRTLIDVLAVIGAVWVLGWTVFFAFAVTASWWGERAARRERHRRRVLMNQPRPPDFF